MGRPQEVDKCQLEERLQDQDWGPRADQAQTRVKCRASQEDLKGVQKPKVESDLLPFRLKVSGYLPVRRD